MKHSLKLILKNELINVMKSLELRSGPRLFQYLKCLMKSKNNHPKLNPTTVRATKQLYANRMAMLRIYCM